MYENNKYILVYMDTGVSIMKKIITDKKTPLITLMGKNTNG